MYLHLCNYGAIDEHSLLNCCFIMCMTSTITRKGHVHNYTVLSSSFTCTHHLSFSNVSPPPVSHFPFPSPFPLLLLLPFQLPIFLLPLLLLLLLPSCTPPSLTPYPTPPSHTPPSVSPLLLHPLPLLLLLIPLPLLFLLPPPFFMISPSPFHSPSSLSSCYSVWLSASPVARWLRVEHVLTCKMMSPLSLDSEMGALPASLSHGLWILVSDALFPSVISRHCYAYLSYV